MNGVLNNAIHGGVLWKRGNYAFARTSGVVLRQLGLPGVLPAETGVGLPEVLLRYLKGWQYCRPIGSEH